LCAAQQCRFTASMLQVKKFFGAMGLKNGCRVIAVTFTAWAFLNFVFNLAAFSSPNFNILVAYQLLPARVDTFGRMWYALSSVSFWIAHIVADVLLLVGVQKGETLLMRPFVIWAAVGVVWEFFFVLFLVSNYKSFLQTVTIAYILIFNIGLPIYFIIVVSSYATLLLEGMAPTDSVILRDSTASAGGGLGANNGKNTTVGGGHGNVLLHSPATHRVMSRSLSRNASFNSLDSRRSSKQSLVVQV